MQLQRESEENIIFFYRLDILNEQKTEFMQDPKQLVSSVRACVCWLLAICKAVGLQEQQEKGVAKHEPQKGGTGNNFQWQRFGGFAMVSLLLFDS